MLIIGCDFHTRYQQIAMLDDTTGEMVERRLEHENGEADRFYRSLPKPVLVGVEATGPLHWFERLLAELSHELWIGDFGKIRASEVRKQKTDERDAQLILELLLANLSRRVPHSLPISQRVRGFVCATTSCISTPDSVSSSVFRRATRSCNCSRRKLCWPRQ